MAMTNYEKARNRYNKIMFTLSYEHLSIGTRLSEDTEDYTIKDMVDECEYLLSTYYQDGHVNGDMRWDDLDCRKAWRSHVGKLTRFIKAYKVGNEPNPWM